VLLVEQHRVVDVVDRDVVLRVVRPLPHIQRRRRVHDYVPIQDGPDPPRDRRGVVHRRQRERMAAGHEVAPADGEEAESGATSISSGGRRAS
jgi:hypothetical protein